MAAWWNSLIVFQRVLFVIGCATTVFLIVQIIMMMVGMGESDTFDGDAGDGDIGGEIDGINDNDLSMGAGLRLLSMRSLIAFFSIGSWLTFVLIFVFPVWASVLLGIVGGAAAGVGVAFFMLGLNKMQASGNIDIRNSIGKACEIYLTVPAARSGSGKVSVFLQERLVELEAVTDGDVIKTGAQARIVGFVNDGLVVVEPYSADAKPVEKVAPPDTDDKNADITL